MTETAQPTQRTHRRRRRAARMLNLLSRAANDELTRFFLEERSRRSFGVTGYLVSGGGGGAIACWFAIDSLCALRIPHAVLGLLLLGSGAFLLAMVIGFFAALAGYKAYDAALLLPPEAFSEPGNRADHWLAITTAARIAAAVLISIGGSTVFAAYMMLVGA